MAGDSGYPGTELTSERRCVINERKGEGDTKEILCHPQTSFFERQTISQPPAPPIRGISHLPGAVPAGLVKAFGSFSFAFINQRLNLRKKEL